MVPLHSDCQSACYSFFFKTCHIFLKNWFPTWQCSSWVFFSLASPFLYFTLLWPILSMSFCTLAHFCQLPLSVHLCSWAFTNLSFLHFRTLSTVLSASASENLCYVGNFELFFFVYGCFSSFRAKLTFFFFLCLYMTLFDPGVLAVSVMQRARNHIPDIFAAQIFQS